jgi:hypothetical protein
MKNRKIILYLSITSILLLTSCVKYKKYSEDKFISTYTTLERLTKFGYWKLESASKGGVELFNINDSSSINEMMISFNSAKGYYKTFQSNNNEVDESLSYQYSYSFKPTFNDLLFNPNDLIYFGYMNGNVGYYEFTNRSKNLLLPGIISCKKANGQYYYLDIEFEIKRLELAYMTLAYKDLEIKFKKVKY